MTTYQKQEWHNNGSACCTPFGTCMLSWCCPCIQYGKTSHRHEHNGTLEGYSCCNGSCMAFCGLGLFGFSWVLSMIKRGDIRAKHHIKGNACGDCLCACCCAPCDLTQQDKEVQYRENQALLGQQPGKVDGMNYSPQQSQPAFHH
ncbi:PLAC8-domain-containing protein [Corynespora cassiicola Philippines]|uniref:PLAC8-domain-containing protein n=1 Tax=Corynespora cassiicola Philippines TaxID=1448308 RepID=A0A2T2P2R0_CORCC|nr:PLAC8-domain-containing protein [Corynespora cassiicola Philippines]